MKNFMCAAKNLLYRAKFAPSDSLQLILSGWIETRG